MSENEEHKVEQDIEDDITSVDEEKFTLKEAL
jgi:hypothetical protein